MRFLNLGRFAFAATFVALGVWGLATGKFNTVWAGVPHSWAWRDGLAYACAVLSIGCGAGLFWRRTEAWAAAVLNVVFLIWIAAFRIAPVAHAVTDAGVWDGFGEIVMIAMTALALFAQSAQAPPDRLRGLTGASGLRIVRVVYGLVLVDFGIAHFGYLTFTASLVPAYLPGHVAWAQATGLAYIAAGLAILSGVWARLAATLVIAQMAGFTLLVWGPVIASGAAKPSEVSEAVISWLLTACAWTLADTWAQRPWLAAPRLRAKAQPA